MNRYKAILMTFEFIAYISTTIILVLTFGWKHGLVLNLALILFGWGMNLQNIIRGKK